jgi:serine/threonine protein kinase
MGDRVGQQFGNYRLARQLGQGGFAEVYLGEHLHLAGRQVAIKLLHARGESFQDFRGEAQTIANLKHPNIVQVLDFGIEPTAGTPYLIMSYASQGTLRDRCPRGTRLPLNEVVRLLRPTAQALFYAHQQGLVHRDIKPENMLIGENDTLLLSDFGIAVASQSVRSVNMESGGTPAYMAPEQMQGKARAASDQYALAIIAYEWLCGSTPFNGPTHLNFMMQHTTLSPPPLCEQVPGLSRESEAVILRALSKDYHRRFNNVLEFIDALAATVFGTTTICRRSPIAGPGITPGANSWPLVTGPVAGVTPPPTPGDLMKSPSGAFTPPPDSSRQVSTPHAFFPSQDTAAPYMEPSGSAQGHSMTGQPYNQPPPINYSLAHQPSARRISGCKVALLVTLVMLVVVVAPISAIALFFGQSIPSFPGFHFPSFPTPLVTSVTQPSPTSANNSSLDVTVWPTTLVAQKGSTTCTDWTNSFYGAQAHWDCPITLNNTSGGATVHWKVSAPLDKGVTFQPSAASFITAGGQSMVSAFVPPAACSGGSFDITITVVESGKIHTVGLRCN